MEILVTVPNNFCDSCDNDLYTIVREALVAYACGGKDITLKEVKDAKIHRDRVPEDRHSELLRLGQGDLEQQDWVDKSKYIHAGNFVYIREESCPISESCACPACRYAGRTN
jgi:hypothetical protein